MVYRQVPPASQFRRMQLQEVVLVSLGVLFYTFRPRQPFTSHTKIMRHGTNVKTEAVLFLGG